MKLKKSLFKELIRKGYSKYSDGRKVWETANRSFLYMTPELSKAFLKLRSHPRYKKVVIETEKDLLKKHAEKFVSELATQPFNLVNMGCGDGTKSKTFIKALKGKYNIRFWSVNADEYLVNLTLKNIKKANLNNVNAYGTHLACLESLHEVANRVKDKKFNKNVILLLGSTLASYDIHSYLFNLSQAMSKGDRIIIGNAIRTGERFANIENYTHQSFKNWFEPIIKELGFKPEEAEYSARFANGRVEIYYEIKTNKKISCGEKEIEFNKGDEIIVGILYKYYERELEEFCKMYFREVELFKDTKNEYALALCKK